MGARIKIFRIIFLVLRFGCLMIVSSCGSRNKDTAIKPIASGGPMVVEGVVLRSQPLDNIVRSSGTVLASESVDLIAEVAGRIVNISFIEGGHVKKGDLLAKINDDDLQAQLRKTELQIQLAADQEKRQKQLYDKNLISNEQYDISQNQLNTMRSDRDNLVASIRKTEIRAPFDGIVGLRYVSEGGYVSPTTHIASIQKINPIKVDFAIPEKYAGEVSVGDPVQLSNNETQLQFTGKLYAIEPKIDPTMGALKLRAICDNKSEKLFPGAYVHIELKLKQINNALMVPTQAVIPVLKGQTVLIRKNGVVVSNPVKVGIRTAANVQIISGLSEGDTVITTGIMQLRPGMPIKVTVK
jgi:membrane fusion protein (multidrug efflux system)